MKAKKIILAAILTLQFSFLFAGNESFFPPAAVVVSSTINMMTLVPSAPAEAILEDMVMENTFLGLSPVTPGVALFEDFAVEMKPVMDLSPVIPSVADFTETADQISIDFRMLAPVIPFEADFE